MRDGSEGRAVLAPEAGGPALHAVGLQHLQRGWQGQGQASTSTQRASFTAPADELWDGRPRRQEVVPRAWAKAGIKERLGRASCVSLSETQITSHHCGCFHLAAEAEAAGIAMATTQHQLPTQP